MKKPRNFINSSHKKKMKQSWYYDWIKELKDPQIIEIAEKNRQISEAMRKENEYIENNYIIYKKHTKNIEKTPSANISYEMGEIMLRSLGYTLADSIAEINPEMSFDRLYESAYKELMTKERYNDEGYFQEYIAKRREKRKNMN